MLSFAAAQFRFPVLPRAAGAITLRVLLLSTLALSAGAIARAQDTPVADNNDEIINVRTDLVTIPAIVTDARGQRIAGLSASDFALRDDGRPVAITYFAAGAERVALAFALDSSGSARDIIAHQREAALALFARFGRGSRVAVLHFHERPELAVPFTTDAARARAGFRFNALAGRGTAIFDAAFAAARSFAAHEGDRAERRIVILISDGLDTASATTAHAAIAEARARGVSFYVIHLPLFAPRDGRLAPRRPARGFRALAEQTGGQFFVVGDAAQALDPRAEYDLAPVFRAIEADLRSQYTLGYYPDETARDGRFHRLEVGLTQANRRRLRVRALREGYFSRRESEVRSQKSEVRRKTASYSDF